MRTTSPPWGVVAFGPRDDRQSLTVSHHDIEAATQFAVRRLDALGLTGGDHVVFNQSVAEEGLFWPFHLAAVRRGARYSCVEPVSFDAARLRMFTTGLAPAAVIGLHDSVVGELAAQGTLAESLSTVPTVLARLPAAAMLEQAGIDCLRLIELGPVLAVDCWERSGAHFDGALWDVSTTGNGTLSVRTSSDWSGQRLACETALRGQVVDEPCGCGGDDPRVVIEA